MAAETEWLADLEEKVRAAVERIDALRQENQTLALRVQELETRHAALPDPEREAIKARVERLTAMLEDLLAAVEAE
jgi:FtsZ-binding cell division protein ZapB